jgi:hypothetical protein
MLIILSTIGLLAIQFTNNNIEELDSKLDNYTKRINGLDTNLDISSNNFQTSAIYLSTLDILRNLDNKCCLLEVENASKYYLISSIIPKFATIEGRPLYASEERQLLNLSFERLNKIYLNYTERFFDYYNNVSDVKSKLEGEKTEITNQRNTVLIITSLMNIFGLFLIFIADYREKRELTKEVKNSQKKRPKQKNQL